ncbi:OmpA family protein [Oceanihabitans sediminis]|uniref:OmpA family protein n=1 Tax=Oceanihabitans sediminis TaxID=1812012 RepID=UPI00299E8756|nr:OmpA family protein [Oceanihabitans sediminis]MDX1774004.1 OmpA family protein [Oceanihabitans sediminis]
MKRITLLSLSLLFTTAFFAQDDYNRWSIEAGANMNKGIKGFASSANDGTESVGGELTARYMVNNKFGVQAGGFFTELKGAYFETEYYGAQLEGVANLGNILGFREWTQRFNVLGHAGAGVHIINPMNGNGNGSEKTLALIAGLTPQLRLSDRIALFADASFHTNAYQDYTWDTTGTPSNEFLNAGMITVSAGIQVYLGKNKKHADWADTSVYLEDLVTLDNRIQVVEDELNDLKKGLEATNTIVKETETKVAALEEASKGVDASTKEYIDNQLAAGSTAGATARNLLNSGYVNVYFKFSKAEPETYSYDAINYLVRYMKENPSAQAELIGYSDEIGSATFNKALSEKRAKKVYDIIVAAGVSADRLSYTGGGVDDSVDKSSKNARQLVRRVTFKLK